MKLIDLTGQRFGKLLVLFRAADDRHGRTQWQCACDCGTTKAVPAGVLRNGGYRSCGCLRRAAAKDAAKRRDDALRATKSEGSTIVTRLEATEIGQKWFFTGEPCSHGHIARRNVESYTCLECRHLQGRRWRRANPEKQKAARRAWEKNNPDKHQQATKRRRERIRDKLRARYKAYYERNKEKYRERGQRIYAANKEEIRARVEAWQKANPDRLKQYRALRRSRRRSASGSHTAEDIQRIRQFQHSQCPYCSVDLTTVEEHLEHLVALARGGSNSPGNLHLTCRICNAKKGTRDPMAFARDIVWHRMIVEGRPSPPPIDTWLSKVAFPQETDPALREAAAALSVAVKHGVSAALLRASMPRAADGRALGPVGQLLDRLATQGATT